MTLNGTRFGNIEYSEDDVIRFENGLIGFPNLNAFVLIEHKPDSPFQWLQSIEEPPIAMLVTEPTQFVPEYQTSFVGSIVLTTATIPTGHPEEMTLNLAGPILIDATQKAGRQVVIDDGSYTVKHRVFAEADSIGVKAAA